MNANRTPVEMITERKNLLSSNGAVSAIANRESFSGHFVELDEEQLV